MSLTQLFASFNTVTHITNTAARVTNTTLQSLTQPYVSLTLTNGARGGVVVKALRYKPAGRGFDSRWCHWNFSLA
jgi:hypothetical protein